MNSADFWAFMPLVILAGGALLVLLAGALAAGRHGTVIATLAAFAAAAWAMAGPQSAVVSNMGIALTPLARFLLVIFSLTAALSLLLAPAYNERHGIAGEEYPATILFATFGMAVLATSLTLLNLFLGLEAISFAFYLLVAFDRNCAESAEAGLKYLLLGAVSAAFIAFGIALIYTGTGTLVLAGAMKAVPNSLVLAGWGFLLGGLAFKLSLVPAHLWTPDVYEGGPTPVVAFLSAGSKTAAGAALLMVLSPRAAPGPVYAVLWALSFLSMVVGNGAALRQRNIKRMLAYSSTAQMGYVLLALVSGTSRGYAAALFYLVAYSAMSLAAFGALAALDRKGDDEENFRGLGYVYPFRGGVLALAMFALAGIPPTVGFMGKFAVFAAALQGGEVTLAVIGILAAAVSVYYYVRIVVVLYLQPSTGQVSASCLSAPEGIALMGAVVAIVGGGLYPAPFLAMIHALFR